jgi:hypothetical protein
MSRLVSEQFQPLVDKDGLSQAADEKVGNRALRRRLKPSQDEKGKGLLA